MSVLAVPFTFGTSFVTKAHAAECLLQFLLSDHPQYVTMMRDCRVAYRLGFVLKQILDGDEDGVNPLSVQWLKHASHRLDSRH